MNAIDYTWHVLAVIQIRGSRVENLEEKPIVCNERNLTVSYTGVSTFCSMVPMSGIISSLIPRLSCMGRGIESGNETSVMDILLGTHT